MMVAMITMMSRNIVMMRKGGEVDPCFHNLSCFLNPVGRYLRYVITKIDYY